MMTENQIEIANIEKELKVLWERNKAQNKTKACLFNLIIYTQEKCRAEYFKDIVVSIIEKFPCRIIFIQRDMTPGQNYLQVTVSNEISKKGSMRFVCDEITIKVAGTPVVRVPYIISPHLVQDLPIYFYWGQDPTSDTEVLPHFQKFADRLIFDSEATQNLQKFSNLMFEKVNLSKMEIMDVNWALIGPWRDVIYHIFYREERIRQVSRTQKATITYNNPKSNYFRHNETQALYLQAWLAAQLGWKIEKVQRAEGKIILDYAAENGPLRICLQPEDNQILRYGAIVKLEIETCDKIHFSVSRQHALHKVIVHISDSEQCFLPYTLPLPNLKRGFNFLKEILYESTSIHYQNMLKQLAVTDWKSIY